MLGQSDNYSVANQKNLILKSSVFLLGYWLHNIKTMLNSEGLYATNLNTLVTCVVWVPDFCHALYRHIHTCPFMQVTNLKKFHLQFQQQDKVYNCATSAMQFTLRKINFSHIYSKSHQSMHVPSITTMRSKRTIVRMCTKDVLYLQNSLQSTALLGAEHTLPLFYEQCYMITTCMHMILTYTALPFILETAK